MTSTHTTGAQDRRGPFRPGDKVQLTDPKGRMHTIILVPGQTFHTAKGRVLHDQLIGQPAGTVVDNTEGIAYQALRPTLEDFVLSMPRGAAVIYPKDAALIVTLGDIFPGATVVEAGLGSGALTLSLLRAVGDSGTVHSFERREEFAGIAAGNIRDFFGADHPAWRHTIGDLAEALPTQFAPGTVDRIVLDMLTPWECLPAVAEALAPGGVVIGYVATVPQLSRLREALQASEQFTEPRALESMIRDWHLEGLAVRPEHRMIGHSGFLLFARRLAPGTTPLERKRRPAATAPAEADRAAWQDPEITSEAVGERVASAKKLRKVAREVGRRADHQDADHQDADPQGDDHQHSDHTQS